MDKFRDIFVRVVLVLALLVPIYFLVAALGTKFGWLDWRIGFGLMVFRLGVWVLASAFTLALVALLLAFFTPPRRGLASALVALLIPALGLGCGFYVAQKARTFPPIHDITTHLTEPPAFSSEVRAAREATNSNPLERKPEGRSFADQQREAYPDIKHISPSVTQANAYATALALAREQGWTIGRADPGSGDNPTGTIEAVAESFWFGFKDDIVIRVVGNGLGARVDMRSVSRVGRGDLGANANRIRAFMAALRERLEAADPGPAPAPDREGAGADQIPPPP